MIGDRPLVNYYGTVENCQGMENNSDGEMNDCDM